MHSTLRLFVYGSLRRDAPGGRHDLLAGRARYLEAARIRGRLYDLGSYPGLVRAPGRDDWVRGELYLLAARQVLAELDEYEGYDPGNRAASPFVRVLDSVSLDSGRGTRAWVYEFTGPTARRPRILSGDYLLRHAFKGSPV
jgi:gamma-glutamylcyclotransferase (GGCT)/AIG2-like uncharacterized protein YtfP